MKKISTLNQRLQKINDLLQDTPPIDKLSLWQFIKYQSLYRKKEKTKSKLKDSILAGREIISWYEKYNQEQLNNLKISCRKYCSRQKRAEYKRNITLFKLGLVNKKPRHPILGPISDRLSILKKAIQKPFNLFHKKFENLRSNVIPQNFNNLAVSAAKVGIRGYRTIKSNCAYVKKKFNSSEYSQYLRNIIIQAENQLDSKPPITIKHNLNPNSSKNNSSVQRRHITHYEYTR